MRLGFCKHNYPEVMLAGQIHPRCSGCGHRKTFMGTEPTPTRELPLRAWLPELRSRHRAKRMFAR